MTSTAVEPRRCRPGEIAEARNTGQVLARAQVFGVAHSRRYHRVELIEPLRQFPVEKTAQFDRAEAAIEKHAIGRLRFRQGEIARDGAGANESIDGFLHGFGNPRIAVAPQERIADADPNPGQIARTRLRDKA